MRKLHLPTFTEPLLAPKPAVVAPLMFRHRKCHSEGETNLSIAKISSSSTLRSSEEKPPVGGKAMRQPSGKGSDAMSVLTGIFKTNPSALRLHREMTICIANGEADRASDLASVLAGVVKRVLQRNPGEQVCAGGSGSVAAEASPANLMSKPTEAMPIMNEEHAEFLVSNVLRGVSFTGSQQSEQRPGVTHVDSLGVALRGANHHSWSHLPFWKDPGALRLTVLESAFEMTLGDDNDHPLRPGSAEAEEFEKRQMALLDVYLTREQKKWERQKGAIARVLVSTAKRLGLTPEEIHAAQQAECEVGVSQGSGRLNVLKQCNIIVRGEVPEMAELQMKDSGAGSVHAFAAEELEVLVKRMNERGAPLSQHDKDLAMFELVMSKSKMRYVVGLHRELQLALDEAVALKKAKVGGESVSGSTFFVDAALKALNKVAPDGTEESAEDVECIEVISAPVLPFTFMLKMCLWFDPPIPM
uniref:Uncharacterized protein n=1 Tax=Trypanosoma congolense (strain IL3000) TaxID=1068625 RepID=G0UWG4_TRYCI|nr:conserved hypothetical protein [Trypanosoma congolense IL3000]